MKKIIFFLLLCIVTLATGCPVSTPKQPGAFKKFNGTQNEVLVKFDNELAKYDCLMSGGNWSETTVSPGNQQTQQELSQLRSREQQILQALGTLRNSEIGKQQEIQTNEDNFLDVQDDSERGMQAAQQQENQLLQNQQTLLLLEREYIRTPPRRKQRRAQLDQQIQLLKQAIAAFPTDQPNSAKLALELQIKQRRQARNQKRLQDQLTQLQDEQTRLGKELQQNQQKQQSLANSLKKPLPTPTPSPSKNSRKQNAQEIYVGCSDEGTENGQPSDNQKALARRVRDNVTYQLIRFTDYQYFQFENDLYIKRSSGSFLADAIEIGGNLAGTITNGERAKTIIHASLAAFQGTRKSASIHYFQEQTADVLITKMQTARNRVLADIIQQMRDNDVDRYSLDAALGDIIRYFYAGTLPRALQELKNDASIDAKEAAENVREVKGLPEPGLATQARRDASVEAFKLLRDLRAEATSGTTAEKAAALTRLQNVVKELEKDTALKANLITEGVTSTTTDGEEIVDALIKIRKAKKDRADDAALVVINNAIVNFGKAPETEN